MLNIGVLASGRGSNFQSIIDSVESGHIDAQMGMLIVDVPDAYAIERAKKHKIPWAYLNPMDFENMNEFYVRVTEELTNRNIGLVCLAGFMRIVRKPLLDAFAMKIINIHPALLPSFKGLHGQRDALHYGVKVAGCTVHFVDEGMDTGPIIIQAAVPVKDNDTEDTLSGRILKYEHKIYPEACRLFAKGALEVQGRKVIIKDGSDVSIFDTQ
jgi:phosphoribosylglycinamide formyltransferase-1